jgi:DNA-binding response OmpR family regulator
MSSLLLVDGDRNFGQAMAIALRLDGLSATAVASVEEATSLLPGPYGTCVVDCLLPGADDLIGQLESGGGIRVVATGVHPEIVGGAARRHPTVATLLKPFEAAELRARLSDGALPEAR